MHDVEIFDGRLGQFEQPDWEPLRALLPTNLCDGFMWMNSVLLDGGPELQAYKHIDTRRYLWLAPDASAYEGLSRDRYRRMRTYEAVEHVFGVRWLLDRATPAEKRALKQVLADARGKEEGHLPPSSPALPLRFVP